MKKLSLSALFCTLALAFLLCFSGMTSAVSYAEASADKTVTDFTTGSNEGFVTEGGATLSQSGVQLIGNGTLSSERGYKSFLAQFVLGSMAKGFVISFGDDANRCSLRFAASEARIYATGLEVPGTGADTVMLSDYLTSGATVQIEVIGGEVEVAVKNENQPYDVLGTPAASFVYSEGKASSRGSITLSVFAEAICAVKEINIYSLDPTVEIPTEDYVAPAEPVEEEKKFNPLYVILPVAGVAAAGAVAAIVIVAAKRRKR